MTYRELAKAQLMVDEGVRKKPYKDTVGKWSIAVGRNLDDVGLYDNEIQLMLENDVQAAERLAVAVGSDFKGIASLILYASAIALALFVHPWIADLFYGVVALVWLVPDRRIETRIHE